MNPDFVKALLDSATIIGAFLGIPALIIAIISLVVSVRRKRLVYTRIGFTKISAIDQERSDKITVDFDRTKEIYIRFFEVKNNGLIPIGSSDFDKPLRFSFGAGTNLVLNVQTKESESTFTPDYTFAANYLEIAPTLFNDGDSVRFEVLLSVPIGQYDGAIEPSARIQGVRTVERIDPADLRRVGILTSVGCILFFIGILLLVTFSVVVVQQPQPSTGIPLLTMILAISVVSVIVFLLSILAAIWSIWHYRRILRPFAAQRAIKNRKANAG